jgi:flagellar basal body-associated protein FliL
VTIAPTALRGPLLPALLGFALTAGAFGAGLAATLRPEAAVLPSDSPPPPAATAEPAPLSLYLPLADPVTLDLRGDRTALLTLTLSVEGPPDLLPALQGRVEARLDDIRSRILTEAQAVAEAVARGGDMAAALRRNLPPRLRDLLNAAVGTGDLPEPVREVLLTELVLR